MKNADERWAPFLHPTVLPRLRRLYVANIFKYEEEAQAEEEEEKEEEKPLTFLAIAPLLAQITKLQVSGLTCNNDIKLQVLKTSSMYLWPLEKLDLQLATSHEDQDHEIGLILMAFCTRLRIIELGSNTSIDALQSIAKQLKIFSSPTLQEFRLDLSIILHHRDEMILTLLTIIRAAPSLTKIVIQNDRPLVDALRSAVVAVVPPRLIRIYNIRS